MIVSDSDRLTFTNNKFDQFAAASEVPFELAVPAVFGAGPWCWRGCCCSVAVRVGSVSVRLFSSLSKFRCFSFCPVYLCYLFCVLTVCTIATAVCNFAYFPFLSSPTLQFVLSIILYLAASCPVLSGAVLAFPLSFPFPDPSISFSFSIFVLSCVHALLD
jgi:hypothetical protein